jgi:hypothetical protein
MKARIFINGKWHWAELVLQKSGDYSWRDEYGNDMNLSSESMKTAVSYIESAYPEGCEIRI